MFLNSPSPCAKLKLALRIMPVRRFGRINPMTKSLIFGLWDVFSTKPLPSNRPSEPMTWKDSSKKSPGDFTPEYPLNTQTNSATSSKCSFKSPLISGPPVINFWNSHSYKNIFNPFLKNSKMIKKTHQ